MAERILRIAKCKDCPKVTFKVSAPEDGRRITYSCNAWPGYKVIESVFSIPDWCPLEKSEVSNG